MIVVALEALAEHKHSQLTCGCEEILGCKNLQIASTMVDPATRSVHQSRGVQRLNNISKGEFRVLAIGNLSPTFIVDDPRDNARVAAMLSDQELQLALEFLLLLGIGEDGFHRAVIESPRLGRSQRRHVLDQHQAELVAGLIEQCGLDFDLENWSASCSTGQCLLISLTCLRSMLKPRSFNVLRSYSIASRFGGVYKPSGQ
jgi:hypothetical protein